MVSLDRHDFSVEQSVAVTPLKSTLTSHSQASKNTATLSLAESALTNTGWECPSRVGGPLQGPSGQAGLLCPLTRHHFRVACLAPLCLCSPSRPLPRALPRSRERVRAVPAHLLL